MAVHGAVLVLVLVGAIGLPAIARGELFSSGEGREREQWERIVGGTKARNGSVPYQVSLRVWGVWHFCGASLVTPHVMLTAAHCVDRMKPEYFKAVVGTNQLRSGGDAYDIRKIAVHEQYDDDVIVNDIALLFTEQEVRFGSTVDAVELNDEPLLAGEPLTLTGWGTTSYPGRLPNDLMQLELRSVSLAQCRAAHAAVNAVFDSQLCALTRAGEGACHGDSGGPLVREGRQVGVVSWGVPCARGKPDVYTKVEAFMRWIERTLYDDDHDHVRYLHARRHTSTQPDTPARNQTHQPATRHTSPQPDTPACNQTHRPATRHTSPQADTPAHNPSLNE